MATAKLIVEDERGVRWLVKPGDPGTGAVKFLRQCGFTHQVIPRAVLMGKYAYTEEQEWYRAQPAATPTVRTRLHDIISALEEYLFDTAT